jgi:hypothetical protein
MRLRHLLPVSPRHLLSLSEHLLRDQTQWKNKMLELKASRIARTTLMIDEGSAAVC